MSPSAKAEIDKLREEIRRHNWLYYVEARPEISDREFDALLQRLQQIEDGSSRSTIRRTAPPSKWAGSRSPASRRSCIARRCSRSTTSTTKPPLRRVRRPHSSAPPGRTHRSTPVEYKIDGVAIGIVYEHGRFVQAVTRGDGTRGTTSPTTPAPCAACPCDWRKGPSGRARSAGRRRTSPTPISPIF